ncbi:MAG: MerR family transcriptional regulator [Proteobacteria bacterium]|nr:MerR family transcriptional regulator [Pseudomonadota bacterium]
MTRNKPTIGTIARQAGINVETIRYYQRIGLVKEPRKTGGTRYYSDKVVKRLLFIRRLKKLSFTLREIADLLGVGPKGCSEVRAILQNKRTELLQEIEQIRTATEELKQMEIDCREQSRNGSGACPHVPQPA